LARKASESELVERAMKGIDPTAYVDVHNHVVGMGAGGTGVYVHPHMTDGWGHPLHWIRFRAYVRASGIQNLERVDQEYMQVLKERVEALPTRGKSLLMAFDQVYDEKGIAKPDDTIFSVPNEYMFKVVGLSDRFAPCASVHPYRRDAVEALHQAADHGSVAVKWLPNAMHIDPANPLCDPSYRVMAERGLTLISHGGEESAVPSPHTQEFGNPLRLRRALDAGVKVVVAHCASHGVSKDLDAPGQPKVRAFSLFLRMMDTPGFDGQLYGEISAIMLLNRVGGVAPVLMRRNDLHHRLVNGSDYPIPGIDPLINLFQLWSMGLIRWRDKAGLSKLFKRNPLLGDFVLKRVLCDASGESVGFPPQVFCPDRSVFPNLTATSPPNPTD
jgi:mannonate dehydratase